MAQATVGRWGKNLAVRVPLEVAKACKLSEGERVNVETCEGDIVIRRTSARARARTRAERAAKEIIADSKRHALGGISIRALLDEGRRG